MSFGLKHTTPKSADAAEIPKCQNWMGMTWEEIDKYLGYEFDASLTERLKRLARSHRKVQLTKPKKSGKYVKAQCNRVAVNVPIVTGLVKTDKKSSPSRKETIPPRAIYGSDIGLKTALTFGATVSPLLNSIINRTEERKSRFPARPVILKMWYDCKQEIELFHRCLIRAKIDFSLFPRLRSLHSKCLSFRNAGFLRFMTALANVLLAVDRNTTEVGLVVVDYFASLEEVFVRCMTEVPPVADNSHLERGVVIVAPPGTGKTQFTNMFPVGFLDTDWINAKDMDATPAIMETLVACGFSFLTNRWEWKTWSFPFYYVAPHDLEASLIRKRGIPSANPGLAALNAAKKAEIRNRKGKQYVGTSSVVPDEWRHVYDGITEVAEITFYLTHSQSLLHAYGELLNLSLLG